MKCILTSSLVEFFRRLFPLFQATWVQVDVLLDGRQTLTYYNHAYSNGTYADWSEKFLQETNSTYHHTVSEWYFDTAMVVWFLSPTLCAFFVTLVFVRQPLSFFNWIFYEKYEIKYTDNCFLKMLLTVLLLPIDVISAAIVIYVTIPFSSFSLAFKILMKREFEDDDILVKLGDFPISSNRLPFWKGFEFIGEALPQLLLAVVLMANNFDFMRQTDTLIGLKEFEVTLTSMIFSLGSICMGLYSAIQTWKSRND